MSLNNENVITKRPQSEPAQVTAKASPGWLDSINPFSAKPNTGDAVANNMDAPALPAPAAAPQPNEQDDDSGWFDFSFKKIAVIIIILLFLGFNVLKMSGEGLESVGSIVKLLFGNIGTNLGGALKDTVDNAATGSKEVIDITKDTANEAVDETEELLTGKPKSKKQHDKDKKNNENLAEAVDKPSKKIKDHEVIPDDAGSTVQQSKGAGKAGWCFVGEDRGFRSCVKVGINDDCASGDIFPSKDICVNPSLRE